MKRNKEWTIYMHISPNGKKYVGQTSRRDVEKRFRNGKGYKGNRMFRQDINYYGWNSFEHKILYTHIKTQEEADAIEIRLIEKLDLMNPRKGYNVMSGGTGKANTNKKYDIERSTIIKKNKKAYSKTQYETNTDIELFCNDSLYLEFRSICA